MSSHDIKEIAQKLAFTNGREILQDVLQKEENLKLLQDFINVNVRVTYIEGVGNKNPKVIESLIYDTNPVNLLKISILC